MSQIHGTSDYIGKRVLILGCGNILFGDDGFGSAAAEYMLENMEIPNDVCVMDVGTGSKRVLFTIAFGEDRPEKLIIIDAMDLGKQPGEVFEFSIDDIPDRTTTEFSVHMFPKNLLRELQDEGIKVIILSCQVEKIPEFVDVGLSESVKKAIPKVAEVALKHASE